MSQPFTRQITGLILPSTATVLLQPLCGLQQADHEYELAIAPRNHDIVLKSKESGQYFVVPWTELLSLARKAGIDQIPATA